MFLILCSCCDAYKKSNSQIEWGCKEHVMKKTSICYSKTDAQNYHTRSPIWPHFFYCSFYTSQLNNKLFMSRMAAKSPQRLRLPCLSTQVGSAHPVPQLLHWQLRLLPQGVFSLAHRQQLSQNTAQRAPGLECGNLAMVLCSLLDVLFEGIMVLAHNPGRKSCSSGRQQLLILAGGPSLLSRVEQSSIQGALE